MTQTLASPTLGAARTSTKAYGQPRRVSPVAGYGLALLVSLGVWAGLGLGIAALIG